MLRTSNYSWSGPLHVDLQARSSMCADALEGRWVTGTGVDLSPPSTWLVFGWASWQTREVATADCVALLSYNH